MSWIITEDHLDLGPDFPSRVGVESLHPPELNGGAPIRFKLYDDDGELYYSGICDPAALDEDESADSLYACLQWAMGDAGATDLRISGKSVFA